MSQSIPDGVSLQVMFVVGDHSSLSEGGGSIHVNGNGLETFLRQLIGARGRRGVSKECIDSLKVRKAVPSVDGSCSVCLSDFEENAEIAELPCKHIFCKDCVVPWLQSKNSCPLCRSAVERNEDENDTATSENTSQGNNDFDTRAFIQSMAFGSEGSGLSYVRAGSTNTSSVLRELLSSFTDVIQNSRNMVPPSTVLREMEARSAQRNAPRNAPRESNEERRHALRRRHSINLDHLTQEHQRRRRATLSQTREVEGTERRSERENERVLREEEQQQQQQQLAEEQQSSDQPSSRRKRRAERLPDSTESESRTWRSEISRAIRPAIKRARKSVAKLIRKKEKSRRSNIDAEPNERNGSATPSALGTSSSSLHHSSSSSSSSWTRSTRLAQTSNDAADPLLETRDYGQQDRSFLNNCSIGFLKRVLRSKNIEYRSCVEKSELVDLILR